MITTYLQVLITTLALIAPQALPPVSPEPRSPAHPAQVQALRTPALESPKAPPLPEVLSRIAWCESRNRHFDKSGRVLRGTHNYYDIGKYQINVKYWGEEAKKLGLDLHTEEGNEALALVLYERYGTEPWKFSRACWNKT